jgi:hypothetical protein
MGSQKPMEIMTEQIWCGSFSFGKDVAFFKAAREWIHFVLK